MVITLLSYLVGTHKISINELSRRSNLSRPALTALVNNTGRGIQFETIDKLCEFFNVPVSKLLLRLDETNCNAHIDDFTDDSTGRKILYNTYMNIGGHAIKADCAISCDGNSLSCELYPSIGIEEDDKLFLVSLTTSEKSKQFIENLLKRSLAKQFSEYDASVSVRII